MRSPSRLQFIRRLVRLAQLLFAVALLASACQVDTEVPDRAVGSELAEQDPSEIEHIGPIPEDPVPLNRIVPLLIADGREVADKLQVNEQDLRTWIILDDEAELTELANLVADPASSLWNRINNADLNRSFVVAANSDVCEHTDAYLLPVDGELHYTVVDSGADCEEPNLQLAVFIVFERFGYSESTIVHTVVQESWSDNEYLAPLRPTQNSILPAVFENTNFVLDEDSFAAPQIVSTDDEREALRDELDEFAPTLDGLNPEVSWLVSVEHGCVEEYWVNDTASGLELVTSIAPVLCDTENQFLVVFELDELFEPQDNPSITARRIDSF